MSVTDDDPDNIEQEVRLVVLPDPSTRKEGDTFYVQGKEEWQIVDGKWKFNGTIGELLKAASTHDSKKYFAESTTGSRPFTFATDGIEHGISIKAPEKVFPESNKRQVGGEHYGLGARQHWDVVIEFDLDYFQAQITKYVFRWDKKNGITDLEKAEHFLQKYIEEIRAGRIKKGREAKRD